jgi:protein gp37
MGDKSKIAWTEATWNTVTGCTPISAACVNCYARVMTKRLAGMGQDKYKDGFDKVVCHVAAELMSQPSRWKRPRKIFVNSMSDTFHRDVPIGFIEQIYEAMVAAPQHIFQVLTKRAERMEAVVNELYDLRILTPENSKHIWHGVTVEDRKSVKRIYPLMRMPSHVRYISAEPLLDDWAADEVTSGFVNNFDNIDWLIIGGESGARARPMNVNWARAMMSVVKFHNKEHVSRPCRLFVKQLGSVWAKENKSKTAKGEDMDEWPEDLRIREMPDR